MTMIFSAKLLHRSKLVLCKQTQKTEPRTCYPVAVGYKYLLVFFGDCTSVYVSKHAPSSQRELISPSSVFLYLVLYFF